MKKLLLFLMLLLPTKVLALNIFQVTEMPYTICDEEGEAYKVNFVRYNYHIAYYFNYNSNYNYHFDDYHELNDDYYKELAQKYLWIYPVINYQTFYNYHQQFATRFLWEKMYPEKTFSFCHEEDSILVQKEREYQDVKQRAEEIVQGIDLFSETHYQTMKEVKTYEHHYLPLYSLIDNDGLEVSLVKDKLTVSGPPGEYQLTFQIKDNNVDDSYLFTDGVNQLATLQKTPTNPYYMHVIIKPFTLTINFNNEDANDVCFVLENEQNSQEKCSINNTISFEVEDDNYHLYLKDNIYFENYQEDFFINDHLSLDIHLTKKEEVFLNESESSEETISFVAKNTFIN